MRYLPLSEADRRQMLAAIGVGAVDDLFRDVPGEALLDAPVDLPHHQGEIAVEQVFIQFALKNLSPSCAPNFIGGGLYRHHVPAAVDHLIQRGEFLTAYTPYQPEIAQGTLQYLFEFQTQVAMLTGMEVANASMYDGATACAEAVLMAVRLGKSRRRAIISGGVHPHYRDTALTYGRFAGIDVFASPPAWPGDEDLAAGIDAGTACVVVQNPDVFGRIHDYRGLAEACHRAGALLVVVVCEAVSLGLVKPPGEMGADIVAGEGQSLGNATDFGGPTVGLFATHARFVRQMPGRLAGETVDADGRRGFVLTLSTREQHIRREKATSNICTNSGLCALAFTIHLTLLGEAGLRRLAQINHANAVALAEHLETVPGVEPVRGSFFNEFTVRLPCPAEPVVEALAAERILAGVPASRLYPDEMEMQPLLIVAATELTSESDMDRLVDGLRGALR
ncbi:MAG TPA: aminomethyl-transferring glycine dehydrogenase subunit GcvPA [Rhodospirillales bacterium]|nr:aminomethyl-transferring glycine dehydrogenase subunit GcvPA [Rhodospirillales bacterium]